MIRTLRLASIGFVCGTGVGLLVLAGTQLTYGGALAIEALPFALIVSSFFGGITGALITPLAWLPVRRIPIGRVIPTTALAAACGGILAARGVGFLGEAEGAFFVMVPGGLAGFALAVLWLRTKASPFAGTA
jgi:hypothetical protein